MQLTHYLISSPVSAVGHQLSNFRDVVKRNEIWRPLEDVQFVFLCGANIRLDTPSKRRQNLLDFSDEKLPHAKFFLAEPIFKVLNAEGNKGNLLDIEEDLSAFSDFVVVILESESAFCELGAFATSKRLREKLIIINDTSHKDSQSFINLGPIAAVNEISDKKNILYYKMDIDGKERGDGIGAIYKKIYELIHKIPRHRRERAKDFNPNENLTKDSFRFVHDLVYLTGPIFFSEISRVVKVIFSSSQEKQLQKHMGLLCATNQIKRSENGLYSSSNKKPFFEYQLFDFTDTLASFKNLYFRYDAERLIST